MSDNKYVDRRSGQVIDLERDGCELSDWAGQWGRSRFARHPEGFKIFLAPDKLSASDEYADADPYSVERNRDNAFHRRRFEITIDLLRQAVRGQGGVPRVLDLGCGEGHITDAMLKALGQAELTGVDYAVSAIRYAHRQFPGIDFSVADAYEAPFAAGHFDVVVCNNLWEHVPDPLRLLGEMKAMLKPGGCVIMSTPSRYHLGNLLRVLRGKPVQFMSPHHVTEYTVGQVIEQFTYGGFKVEAIVSRPIEAGSWKRALARAVLSPWLKLVGSHHQLEMTAFYLARRS